MNGKGCEICRPFKNTDCSKPDFAISDSVFFGPSFDEIVIYLLSFLPESWLDKIGFLHDTIHESDKEQAEKKSEFTIDLNKWLKCEYISLAKEVSERGCRLDEDSNRIDTALLESRKFVLNRLAELMRKKSEIEVSLSKGNVKRKRCNRNDIK